MFIRKLLKNTMIFALGNIFSKSLIILLLPVLTRYYSSREFGYIDLFTVLLSLFIYIIGLNTSEFLLKEVSHNNEDSHIKKIVSSVMQITIITSLIFLLIGIVCYGFGFEISIYVTIASILQVFDNLLKQLHRAIDNNIVFIVSEILYSIAFCILVLLSITFKLEYYYYFYAVILAFTVSIIYSLFSKNLYKHFDIRYFDKKTIWASIEFSFPLMLNSVMWYIVNLGNRYFLIFFIGISASGIFAANMRLPLMIVLLYSYVYKALQILIYRNNNENTKPAMNTAFGILFIAVAVLSLLNNEICNLLLDGKYQSLSPWLPLMYLSAIYSSYSSVLGINFMITNNTKKAFISSTYSAIISLISNIIFIPMLGVYGAVIAMAISFISLVIIRLIMIKDLKIYISNNKLIASTLLILGSLFFSILKLNVFYYNILVIFILLLIYYKDVKSLKES